MHNIETQFLLAKEPEQIEIKQGKSKETLHLISQIEDILGVGSYEKVMEAERWGRALNALFVAAIDNTESFFNKEIERDREHSEEELVSIYREFLNHQKDVDYIFSKGWNYYKLVEARKKIQIALFIFREMGFGVENKGIR